MIYKGKQIEYKIDFWTKSIQTGYVSAFYRTKGLFFWSFWRRCRPSLNGMHKLESNAKADAEKHYNGLDLPKLLNFNTKEYVSSVE